MQTGSGPAAYLVSAPLATTADVDLEAARAHHQALRTEEAVLAARRALARPGRSLEELVELHQLLGLALAVEGDDAGATAALDAVLALDPDRKLGEEESPKLVA